MRKLLISILILTASALCSAANLCPNGTFGNNAVLQRNTFVPVWGTATPGDQVTVSFHGTDYSTVADRHGKWQVRLNPMPACCEPAELTIKTFLQTIVYKNIVVGDVWFASGQSNMAYMMKEGTSDKGKEMAAADYPMIRFRNIEPQAKSLPLEDHTRYDWLVCSPGTVGDFSAVSYFFAKELHLDQNIPVGVIVSAVGASGIAGWMSRESLLAYQPLREQTLAFNTDSENWERRIARVDSLNQASADVLNHSTVGIDQGVTKLKYDDSEWNTTLYPMDVPKMGYLGFWGLIWTRKHFEIPSNKANRKWSLHIPMIVSDYRSYINGKQVNHGNTSLTDLNETIIEIPAKTLRKGENVLSLRLWIIWSLAIIGNDTQDCYLLADDGTKIDLKGEWKHNASIEPEVYRLQDNYWFEITALYNGMVAPVIPYAITGFLWYQGEANHQWGQAYSEMQPRMADDWRIRWGQGYLPFLYVQLAAFGDRSAEPVDQDYMAEFRDWQTKIMDMTTNSWQASAIDAGEEKNVHPRRKDVVGKRLYTTYKTNVLGTMSEGDSPRFKAAVREGSAVRISFIGTSVLKASEPDELTRCIALCGSDGKWHWAKAEIDGNEIIAVSEKVPEPVKVQYAYQGTPYAPLYNGNDIPVLPFKENVK